MCETQRAHRKGSNFWWTVELGRLHTISTRTSGNGRLQNMTLDSGRLGWLIVVFVSLETVVDRDSEEDLSWLGLCDRLMNRMISVWEVRSGEFSPV